jgi:D-alanyl-D-alanine dipeptidase
MAMREFRMIVRRAARAAGAAVAGLGLLAGCGHGGRPGTPLPASSSGAAAAAAATVAADAPAGRAAASVNAAPQVAAPDALADSLLMDVREADSTIRVDARYSGSHNFTGAPLPGYEANRALLRREAAQALGRVQARLRTGGLGLKVFDGYRPVRATVAMVAWAERTGQTHLLDDGYIARRSRHNQGVAVDLTLVEATSGFELDLGTPFDTFSEAAHTANATGRVARYRQLLVKVMEEEGFKNYDQEWWHFTYEVPNPVPFDRVIR